MVERYTATCDYDEGYPVARMVGGMPDGKWVDYSDYAVLERQIAALRAERDKANAWAKEQHAAADRYAASAEAAEAENARLRALPLKDEVERVVKLLSCLDLDHSTEHDDLILETCVNDARALLPRLRAGEQEWWRSMDSAPKDGENILYRNKFRDIGFCHWDEGYDEGDQPCWWDNEADQEVCPIAWLPADILPAFPAAPSEQGGDRG